MEKNEIIEACVSLADNFGSDRKAFVSGYLSDARTAEFEDGNGNWFEVLIDKNSQAVEIAIYGSDFTSGGDGGNPAVNVTREGELIRWHGEMYNALPFIKQTLSNMGLVA